MLAMNVTERKTDRQDYYGLIDLWFYVLLDTK